MVDPLRSYSPLLACSCSCPDLLFRPAEAARIQDAARRVVAGESLRTIVNEWNRAGVAASSGGRWRVTSLRTLLAGPRIAGLRQHRGEVVGEAAWPAIIDRATHEQLVAVLGDPRRRQGPGRPPAYLLSSFLECGREGCGTTLHASRSNGRRVYSCRADSATGACGRLSVVAEPLEEEVATQALAVLDTPAFARRLAEARDAAPDIEAAVRQLRIGEAGLEALARDHYAHGVIGRAEFLAAREAIEGRMTEARAVIESATGSTVLANLPRSAGALTDGWEAARAAGDVDHLRTILGAVVERVVVHPAQVRGRRFFDPERVAIVWRA